MGFPWVAPLPLLDSSLVVNGTRVRNCGDSMIGGEGEGREVGTRWRPVVTC